MLQIMTTHTEPFYLQLFRVVGVMGLYSYRTFAGLADRWSYQLSRDKGPSDHSPRPNLQFVSDSGNLAVFPNAIWVCSLPVQHTQSVALSISAAPFIATLFGSIRILTLPFFRNSSRAILATCRSALRMTATQMEIFKRFIDSAGATLFHGITILQRNHYEIVH